MNPAQNVEAGITSLGMMMEVAFVLGAITTSVLLTPLAGIWVAQQMSQLNGKNGL
jgi:hypothetical protein